MCLPADSNVIMSGDKSFAYDLHVQRSIVSSRVALLLRSAEIKLQLSDLFVFTHNHPLVSADRSWCVLRGEGPCGCMARILEGKVVRGS